MVSQGLIVLGHKSDRKGEYFEVQFNRLLLRGDNSIFLVPFCVERGPDGKDCIIFKTVLDSSMLVGV